MKFLSSMVWSRYLASLKMALLFVFAVNLVVPVLALVFSETRPYADMLAGLHIVLWPAEYWWDQSMDLQFFVCYGLTLIIMASVVAVVDFGMSHWLKETLPIRIALCALWYPLVLGLAWFITLTGGWSL